MVDYSSPTTSPQTRNEEATGAGKLDEQACFRLGQCEAQKNEWDLDIREGYFFAAPHRAREIRSRQRAAPMKPTDAGELQTGIAMEYAKDFATVILNAFMPEASPWAERKPGMFLAESQKAEAKAQVEKQDPIIFQAIRASNLYPELPKAFNPDLALGVCAIWIDDPRPAENFITQAVPLHELEINLGPFGEIDDRFVVRHTKNRHVMAVLGPTLFAKIDAACRDKIEKQPNDDTIIRWGFWRLWDRRDDIVWQHVVMIDEKVIHSIEIAGEGCCPLIVMRFNPSPEWAYAAGPLIEGLPDLRELDTLAARKIEHVDLALAPPSTFPDDSMGVIEGGVESGKIYPVRPGSEGAVKSMFTIGSMEPAIYETSEKEKQLRHRFFLDWPEQRGDTPPTATQWLDEMQIAQRRIGTPGLSFWREGPAEIFLRFKYMLEKRGIIEPIRVNGKTISLQPFNPAQSAAEQQEVAMFARFAQIGAPMFPEEWKIATDGAKTLQKLAEKMRVTALWVQRSEEDKKTALAAIAQLQAGQAAAPAAMPGAA